MANKAALFIVFAAALVLSGFSSAEALNVSTFNTTPISSDFTAGFIDINTNTAFNVTIATNATDGNVTNVVVSFGAGASYVAGSNATTLSAWAFSTGANSITWTYGAGATAFVPNETNRFYFNITAGMAGQLPIIPQVTVTYANASNSSVSTNAVLALNVTETGGVVTAGIITVNFAIAGFVKNETGQFSNNTNVTVYASTMQANAPPVDTFLRSVRTDANGYFNITGINATNFASTLYKIRIIHYNDSAVAVKTGPTLPPFPGMLFSPPPKMIGLPEFEAPPSINGTTFTLQPAVTLNISAFNVTGQFHRFGYEVSDINSGFPVDSSIFASVNDVQVVVPAGRDYNVMVVRVPWNGAVGFLPGASSECNGTFINASTCPSMPRSNASTGSLTATGGSTINVRFNMTDVRRQFTGCLSVTGNVTKIDNITGINLRMMPYAGFVPPAKADDGSINVSSPAQMNMTFHAINLACPTGAIAKFNLTLLNAGYLVEFYGANDSVTNASYTVGVVQNISASSSDENLNLTMRPMLGSWYTAGLGAVNTSKMLFNFTNVSGAALTAAPNAELIVNYKNTGKLRYIIDTTGISSGVFYFPIVNDTDVFARINVFGRGPPAEKKVLLNDTKVRVIVDDSAGFGFRRILANGTVDEDMNVSAIPITMRFLTNSAACNVAEPASSCELATISASAYNPFKVMMASKVNLEMKLTGAGAGIKITYVNFDLFQAKPPTNTLFSTAAESLTAADIWKFGSFAPADAYDYAIIAVPYSDATFDDAKEVRVTIPVLYDEDLREAWNSSLGHTRENLTYEYAGAKPSANYNSTGYVDFLSTDGVRCSTSNLNINSFFCYIDTTGNKVYLRVPHFSSLSPKVSGSTTSQSTGDASGGGGGGGGIGETRAVTIVAEISPGAPATITLDGKRTGIASVALEVAETVKDVRVQVTKLNAKPATIAEAATGTLYSYFDFSVNIDNTNIKSAMIKFQVPQKWLADNGISKNTVRLQRWANSKWDNLGASLLSEDKDYAYYESATPGFSTFAVTGEKIGAVAAEQPATPGETAAQQQMAATAKPAAVQTTAVLVAVLIVVIAIVAYTMLPKKRRGWR